MAITPPAVDATAYLDEDSEDVAPKVGTTVQSGWGAADALLQPKASGDFPNDFKFTTNTQLIRFLQDEPFSVYESHWIEREGRKSFVCVGDNCPLCTIVGDKPRGKFAFNVLVLSDEEPNVQILTAPPTFARQLRAANDDPKRGPLTKFYWAVSRQGAAAKTTYTLDRVRAADLMEEWDLDSAKIDEIAASAVSYDASAIYVTPQQELLTVARSVVA